MASDPASLPRDPDRLIEIIIELQERNAHLQGMVDTLKRVVYGPRSEKLIGDSAQLPLDLGDAVITETPAAARQRRWCRAAVCPSLPSPTEGDAQHWRPAEAPASLRGGDRT